jgi:MSHA biogenesis protein MshO
MNKQSVRGFTLIEAIITMIITGILAGIVAVFIKAPVESYIDTVRRADLTDAADGALRRIARDVHAALPNSLRSSTSPTPDKCFELLPVIGAGRYREAPPGNVFDFTTTEAFSFDVLANHNLGSLPSGTNHLVVYNLGISGADAYAGGNRRSISTVAGTSPAMTISMLGGVKFPLESSGKRFHVMPNHSLVYSCVGDKLLRSKRNLSATPLSSCPLTGDVLVSNVSACSFSYTPAVSKRNGQLTLRLGLTQAGESVQLYQEVHIDNLP